MKVYYYYTDMGKIGIAEEGGNIRNVYFETDALPRTAEISETEAIKEASRQLRAYLAGGLEEFSLPLAPSGTAFLQSVWRALRAVPYGETRSYKDIAAAVGNPKAHRAVGLANNRNPIPIFIPCHRIIGSNGKLTGYRGGLPLKKRLLELEERRGRI